MSSTTSIYTNLPASTQAALASSSGSSSPLQVTGLASGLNTQQIIEELVDIAALPVVELNQQQAGLQTQSTTLTSLQTSLQGVALDAQALSDPTLFANTQTATSSNSSLITASTSGGAPIGSYSVTVSQLANAASRTFDFASPTSDDDITIDGQAVGVTAGETANQFIASVNNDSGLDVYAASNSAGQIVLSSRSTGQQTGSYIAVSDPGGALSEDTGQAYAGQDAEYAINGVAGTPSASNTVANAIPGVNLTLGGTTGSGSSVTVTVQPPGPSASGIEAAVNTFVQAYNAAIGQVQTQVTTAPATGTTDTGSLFGDSELENLLSDMRTANYTPGAGLPAGMASLSDIGISTGAPTGAAATSTSTLQGQLTVNTTTLANAIATNPAGVQQVLAAWSQSFQNVVNNEAAPGGALDSRIQGDTQEISQLGDQITTQNEMLVLKQQTLTDQYSQLESTLSTISSQSSWLSGQTTALAANSAASAS